MKEGDHVVCTFIPSCGKCIPCKEGRPALCENGAKANEKGEMLEGVFDYLMKMDKYIII